MVDPVISASGQTYERDFIKKWIDLGLTVCPKTSRIFARTNVIPNYTMKALIANWCESNNVKLPGPVKSLGSNQPYPLLQAEVKKSVEDLMSTSIDTRNSVFFPSRSYSTISGIVRVWHPRAKEKAQALLIYFRDQVRVDARRG